MANPPPPDRAIGPKALVRRKGDDICSGGKLEQFCKANDYDCILVPGGNPPRSALAYSVIQLLHIFATLGFSSHQRKEEMIAAGAFISEQQDEIHALAKEMAAHLFGKVGVYYAETKYEGIIVRAPISYRRVGLRLFVWSQPARLGVISLPTRYHSSNRRYRIYRRVH